MNAADKAAFYEIIAKRRNESDYQSGVKDNGFVGAGENDADVATDCAASYRADVGDHLHDLAAMSLVTIQRRDFYR